MNYEKAVALAKAGREEGFRFLYEATYRSKYYLALQYMKNEEVAKDVLQDAYIRAFSKLDQLKEPDAFAGWLGRIVANTAKNKLIKNEPVLFSDVAVDEDMEGFEYRIEDEEIENQPEPAYTKQELRELVRELIDSLSEEQRMCILLFYIEGASIREIASTLGCSENTVKSRLNYGRKNLKVKAEELKKKGYKLYGMAPLPLLLYLLRAQEAGLSESSAFTEAGKNIAEAVFQDSALQKGAPSSGVRYAAENGVKTAAKTVAKSGFLHTVAGKTVAVIACICIAGGAVYGISNALQKPVEPEITVQQEEAAPAQTPEATATPAVKELAEADYPELLAGQLTREELEFVLAYGPEEIPEQGFGLTDYTFILNTLCQGSDLESGIIKNYGANEQWESQYSAEDINRLFSVFTDYRFEEGMEHAEMIRISGDAVIFFPATLSYTAEAGVTKTEYTDGKIHIYYTYEHNSYENGISTSYKKAVLEQGEDGTYRIVRIEEIFAGTGQEGEGGTPAAGEQPESGAVDGNAGNNGAMDPTADSAAVKEFYTDVLDGPESGSSYYFICDMNGDGIQELLVSTEVAEGPFLYNKFHVYTCEKEGESYALKPVSGEITALGLCIAGDGNGLFTQELSRGTGEMRIYRITIQDGTLVKGSAEQSFTMGDADNQAFIAANPSVEWMELSDRSAFTIFG
ncbi:RNA polymerase sigma factor [Christensenella tenuis]|jgi:RNA polymerase sigma factor (sigma-70 family)|uniref:Sigma-70 family RNA polymerase sigma factor n=1 Tax=Christensenella tenuis TaxID=2763033 RepID=A0ABR7EAQ9_9FIRM|nr:sigma-70 family RNA polymerase sigma factor [Christensenella tenuis]MBC5646842.1 sigma-70 family RNA polymerase sigma factor [Christensenella tenuis]